MNGEEMPCVNNQGRRGEERREEMIKHELGDGCDAALELLEKSVELGR